PIPMEVIGVRPLVRLRTGVAFLDVNDALTLVFTNNVDESTLGGVSVTVDGVPATGSFSMDGNEAVFTPDAPWTEGALVAVEVGSGVVSDASSVAVQVPFRWRTSVRPTATTAETGTTDGTGEAFALSSPVFFVAGDVAESAGTDLADFYSFDVEAGETLEASIFANRDASSSVGARLQLLDSDGVTVLQRGGEAFRATGDIVDAYLRYVFDTAGTYYIVVDSDPNIGTFDFSYELLGDVR
ncbi:MAG: PPC domain-containing protein, partial [Myxococcota bacterium]